MTKEKLYDVSLYSREDGWYEPYYNVQFDAEHRELMEGIFKLMQGEAEAALALGNYDYAGKLIKMLKDCSEVLDEEVHTEGVELDSAV